MTKKKVRRKKENTWRIKGREDNREEGRERKESQRERNEEGEGRKEENKRREEEGIEEEERKNRKRKRKEGGKWNKFPWLGTSSNSRVQTWAKNTACTFHPLSQSPGSPPALQYVSILGEQNRTQLINLHSSSMMMMMVFKCSSLLAPLLL